MIDVIDKVMGSRKKEILNFHVTEFLVFYISADKKKN